MRRELERYFIPNEEASCFLQNGKQILISVDRKNNKRSQKAFEQARKSSVFSNQIITYANDFLDAIICGEPIKKKNVNTIELDGFEHIVSNNGIVVRNCNWKVPKWDGKKYSFYDSKYDVIKNVFDLKYANNIIWLKFTTDGYLGVVADSFDINFNYDNSSGKLLRQLIPEKQWDKTFVIIFPLRQELLSIKSKKEIETGVGNYLIEKEVPIIDFYSHNNFK